MSQSFRTVRALLLLLAAGLLWCGASGAAERTPFQIRCEDTISKTVSVLSAKRNGYTVDNHLSARTLTVMKDVAPPGTFVGHDALDKFAGDLRATHPHFVYTPHGAPQVLHNSGRLAWGSGPKGETPEYTGVDFILSLIHI